MIKFLPWDSEFFEKRIGYFITPEPNESGWQLALQEARSQSLDCLYLLVDIHDSPTIHQAERNKFHLVDIRVTLELALKDVSSHSILSTSANFRFAQPSDLPILQQIARQSHHETRFFSDQHFNPTRSAEMYVVWIKNCLEDDANTVWVPLLEDMPVGYLTCNIEDNHGNIGLVALAPHARGIGIGSALLDTALEWFSTQGISHVSVITQGRNLAAQRLYQHGGFYISRMQLWYHKWFTDKDD